jgi:hypothetical protein
VNDNSAGLTGVALLLGLLVTVAAVGAEIWLLYTVI